MFPYLRLFLPMVLLAALGGCGPDYSPNTYSTAAVQQANKVEQGVIAGYREVRIRTDGTVGAVTGGAAGGVLGAQEPDGGVVTALSAIGGTLVGGIIGAGVEHATDDTTAFEYLVRKTNGDLLSVTQKDTTPLAVGLKVLVIEGKQARIVADYSVPPETPAPSMSKNDKNGGGKSDDKTKAAKTDDTNKVVTTNGAPPNATPPDAAPAPALQPTPVATQPAAEPHAADSGPAPQSPAAQAPAPLVPAPQADQASPAEAAAPPASASQQSAPAAASPPTPSNQSGGEQSGEAPPASDMPASGTPAPAPAPADSKAMP